MTLQKALHSKQYKQLKIDLLPDNKVYIELKRRYHIPMQEPVFSGVWSLSYAKRVYQNLNLEFNPTNQ